MQDEPRNTNVYLACFTTTWARLKLLSLLELLDERVLYYDTDSVIYRHPKGDHLGVPYGPFLGQLKDELSDDHSRYIVEFVCTGPKSYSYRDNHGRVQLKFKGITKSLYNLKTVNFEAMLSSLDGITHYGAKNLIFKSDPHGRVRTYHQPKLFRAVYDKREIGDDYYTYPYGY